ncbi:hypothetical protein [Streptomyces cyaneofuscatus]|uniref:hypothetical protein n=1 Tax=Streptomyces cyaneofuscatus TaxID=66883 RepID=UPI0036DABB25
MPRKIRESLIPGAPTPHYFVEGAHPWDYQTTRESAEQQAAELDAKDKAEAEGRR